MTGSDGGAEEADFGRDSWERRWSQVADRGSDVLARRPPNPVLVGEVAGLEPGHALDAGCGHGAEAIWLAASGWEVTAVDFSATALDVARSLARAAGPGVAARVEWLEADLGSWTPPPDRYDLVSCLYVHVAGSVVELVGRLGSGVAPGGTLVLVGHRPVDPATGAPTPAAGQNQVSVDEAVAALDPSRWDVVVAAERERAAVGTGVDAVVRAVRLVKGVGAAGRVHRRPRGIGGGSRWLVRGTVDSEAVRAPGPYPLAWRNR